jgi:hypothetical protein
MKQKIEVGQVWKSSYDTITYQIIKIQNNAAYDQKRVFVYIDKDGYANLDPSWQLIKTDQCVNDCCREK